MSMNSKAQVNGASNEGSGVDYTGYEPMTLGLAISMLFAIVVTICFLGLPIICLTAFRWIKKKVSKI